MMLRNDGVNTTPIALFLALFTVTIMFSTSVQADEADDVDQSIQPVRYKFSLGAGVQYGGVFGGQGSILLNNNRFRLGVGLIGITPGYDYLITPNIALGAQIFINHFFTGAGVNINYHFNSHERTGWLVGLEAHRGYNTDDLVLDGTVGFFDFLFDVETDNVDSDFAKIENRILLSVGYQF